MSQVWFRLAKKKASSSNAQLAAAVGPSGSNGRPTSELNLNTQLAARRAASVPLSV
jgi:hypothetical protein